MTDSKFTLPLWPFLVADVVLLGLAALLLRQGHKPLLWWEALLLIVCGTAAAGCFLFPFLRRNQDEQSMSHARLLAEAVQQIQQMDQVASQIAGATSQWRELHQQTGALSESAKSLAGSMAAESKSFAEFLQKASDGEKAHLRLEVDKLRRAEADWLQVVIHILDHVSALYLAAQRSGQPGLIEQIGQFHNSCRDTARRIGLAPVAGREGEPFNSNLHQLRDKSEPAENTVVAETLALGYTFQGRLVRRALVALQESAAQSLAEQPS